MFGVLILSENEYSHISIRKGRCNVDFRYLLAIAGVIVFFSLSSAYWGIDQKSYEQYYYEPAVRGDVGLELNFATGFNVVCRLFSLVSWNFWSFRLMMFLFFLTVICWMIAKYSKRRILSLYIFCAICGLQLFFSERQMMAFSLMLLALEFWKNWKKGGKFISILLAIAAIFVHQITLAGVGIFILQYVKKRCNSIKILIFIGITLFGASRVIELMVDNYRGGMYKGVDYEYDGFTLLIVQFIVLLSIHFYMKKKRINDFELTSYYNMYVIACMLQIISVQFVIFNRCRLFYVWSLSILIPNLLTYLKKIQNKRIILAGICLLITGFYLIVIGRTYPYISMFSS
ncbi:MAG: EpsG family protein [Ruminococcus flavefaciens]|nr:EpsG family protein [Ruminococcus flavefaciens]